MEAGVSQGTDPNGTATRPDYSKLREKSGLLVLHKVLLGHSHVHLHAVDHCLCAPVGELTESWTFASRPIRGMVYSSLNEMTALKADGGKLGPLLVCKKKYETL